MKNSFGGGGGPWGLCGLWVDGGAQICVVSALKPAKVTIKWIVKSFFFSWPFLFHKIWRISDGVSLWLRSQGTHLQMVK